MKKLVVEDIVLDMQIDSDACADVPIGSMGSSPAFLQFTSLINANVKYAWDISALVLTTQRLVIIQYKLVGATEFTSASAPLLVNTPQGIVDALNTLNLGYFYLCGNVIITYSIKYIFGQIDVFGDDVPMLEMTFNNNGTSSHKFDINGNAIFGITVDWGDGTAETFSGATNYRPTHTYSSNGNFLCKVSSTDYSAITVLRTLVSGVNNRMVDINNINLLTNLITLDLGVGRLTSFNKVLPSTLQSLSLSNNLLTSFDYSILPDSVTFLNLNTNSISGSFNPIFSPTSGLVTLLVATNSMSGAFDPSTALPSTLQVLNISSNTGINAFNPSIALPNSLLSLNMNGCRINTFNPTSHPLPSNLQSLQISGCNLSTFNPSLALPASLTSLNVGGNQFVSFDPVTHALPSNLISFSISRCPLLTTFTPTTQPFPATITSFSAGVCGFDVTGLNNALVFLDSIGYSTGTFELVQSSVLPPQPPVVPTGAGLVAKAAMQGRGCTVNTDT